MNKAREILSKIDSSVKDLFVEGSMGYVLKTYGEDDPKLVAVVRDHGEYVTISFEIDGKLQKPGIKINKKKKSTTRISM